MYHSRLIESILFQFVLFYQWKELQKYCRNKGIRVFGDVSLDGGQVILVPAEGTGEGYVKAVVV